MRDRMDAREDFADIYPDVVREHGKEVAQVFRYYIEHYGDALPRMLPGMEQLLGDLNAAGYRVWGLTNWSHETFHIAFEKYPQLERLLRGTVVSGVEKMHKPNADIYRLAEQRFGLTRPAPCSSTTPPGTWRARRPWAGTPSGSPTPNRRVPTCIRWVAHYDVAATEVHRQDRRMRVHDRGLA